DLVLAGPRDQLMKVFPDWEQRRRFLRYLVSRYAPLNVIWMGVEDFETYNDGRAVLKEVGAWLKEMDPYQHPRSTVAQVTSAPLLEDGWMDFRCYGGNDDQVAAIEHQLYASPAVSLGTGREDTGDADAFRHRLWNAAMNGEYITYSGSGASA